MIEIIELGKEKFEAVCTRCGCRFTYQLEDLKMPVFTECVECPECGKVYYHPIQKENEYEILNGSKDYD